LPPSLPLFPLLHAVASAARDEDDEEGEGEEEGAVYKPVRAAPSLLRFLFLSPSVSASIFLPPSVPRSLSQPSILNQEP
jgi:hypothetical protein